ncbi:MAG: hypothetical protein MJE66_13000 [Proteobacteria bacterium]|nr:hypothetical protein [Pseudomonadota bacterium]
MENALSQENALTRAANPGDLAHVDDGSMPYEFNTIFSAEGMGAGRNNKNRLKLMQSLDTELQKFMEDGENVRYVSWGIHYSFFEFSFLGLWALLLNRRAVVLTDRRVLLLQIDSRRNLKELRFQIRYDAIEKLGGRALGRLVLVFRNRKKMALKGIPRSDRKIVRELLQTAIQEVQVPQHDGPDNLCPHCARAVTGFPAACPHCQGAFKSGARAGWLSLAFPGAGDLYLGHRMLGAFEVLGAVVTWAIVTPVLYGLVVGGESVGLVVASVVVLMVFGFMHGMDAWLTRHMGFKGIYPQSG